MSFGAVRTWREFAEALDRKREERDDETEQAGTNEDRAQGVRSVVDNLLPPVSFVGAFEQNLVAFCARLPVRSRRALVDDFVREALRDGLAATLFARGERSLSLKLAATTSAGELRDLGSALERSSANWALLYAAEELLFAANDDSAVATGFCLRRAGQLLALVPRRPSAPSGATGKEGASVAVLARQSSNRFASDLDVARAIGKRLQLSLGRRRRKGWAALAPLLSEVHCYFGSIPTRKRKMATEKLGVERMLLLGLVDLSVLGSAACCVCILSDGVAVRNDWSAKQPGQFTLPFAKLAGARALDSSDIFLPLADVTLSTRGTTLHPPRLAGVLDALASVTSLDADRLGGMS